MAGILSGRVNPSGKLPVGVPAQPGGQPGTYLVPPLGWFSDGISNLDPRPLYPFGHGLSYTTFAMSDLVLDHAEVPTDGVVEASVTVTNTGPRAGTEVVQVYLDDVHAQVTRPVKELIGFARVDLDAGDSARLTFTIHMDRTSFTGVRLRRIVEPGAMRLLVGSSSEDLPLVATFTIVGQVRQVPEGRVLTTPVRITPLDPPHSHHDSTTDEGARR